ncbi:MAG: hypothetical protein AABZ60_01465 [Planctomycetota bacterium]
MRFVQEKSHRFFNPEWLILGFLLLGCFAYSFFNVFNTDFGFSIRMGQYLRFHQYQIPTETIFLATLQPRYTPDDKWFFHIVFSWFYDLLGISGLIFFRILLVITSFTFLYKALRRFLAPWPSLLFCLIAIMGTQEQFMIRATLVSIAFLSFHLFLFSRPVQRLQLFLFGASLWIWCQCHAYFILGQMVFFVWAFTEIIWPDRFSRKHIFLISGAILLIPLIHPYGVGVYYFPWTVFQNLLGQSQYYQGTLSELVSPFAHEDFPTWTQRLYFGYLWVGFGLLLLRWRSFRDRMFLFYALEFLGFFGLSVLARKNIGIFVPVATLFLGYGLKPWLDRISLKSSIRPILFLGGLPLFLGYLYLPLSNTLYIQEQKQQRAQLGISEMIFPERAVDYLLKHQLPRPLFNSYEIGSYLVYRCFPETPHRPYILTDYGSGGIELIDQYQKILRGEISLSQLRQKEGIKTFLFKHTSANMKILMEQLLHSSDYILVYVDELAVIFVDRNFAQKYGYPLEEHLEAQEVPLHFFFRELPWKKFYVAGFYQTLYETLKRRECLVKARSLYLECLKAYPDYPKAQLNLASIEASFGGQKSLLYAISLVNSLLHDYPSYRAALLLKEQIQINSGTR